MLLRCSMCIPQMLTELIEMISNWSGFYHSIESLNAAAAATLHSDPEKVVEGTWRYTLTLANYTVCDTFFTWCWLPTCHWANIFFVGQAVGYDAVCMFLKLLLLLLHIA